MMNYSDGAIAKFLQCFERNDIRIESDNLDKLKKTICEAIDVSKKIYVESSKNSHIRYEADEINYTTKTVERRREVYPYKIFFSIASEKEKRLLTLIEDTFFYFRHGCFDLNGLYEKVYEKNTEIFSGYQFDITRNNFDGITDEVIQKFYVDMGYTENACKILNSLREECKETFDISSIELYRIGKLKSITYQVSFENILNPNFLSNYENYDNFLSFRDFIASHQYRKDKEIFLQISPNGKGLSIEIFPNDSVEVLNELKTKYSMNIENEFNYAKNFNVEYYNNHKDHSLKLLWKNKNNMNVYVTKSILRNEKIIF